MDYGVFIDSGRHTCICVGVAQRFTRIIAFAASSLCVSKVPHDTFAARWKPLADYPVQRAAANYLKSMAAAVDVTVEARAYLELLRDAVSDDDFAQIQTTVKEIQMNAAAETTTAKPAKGKAPAAKGKAPAAKGKAPAAKGKAKIKAEKPGRTSPFAGMKIKVLSKDVGAREGTLRYNLRTEVISSKTADEAMAKTVKHDGEMVPVTGTVLSNMVKAGIVALS